MIDILPTIKDNFTMIVSRKQTTSNDWEFRVLVIFKIDCMSSQTIDVHLPIFPGVLEIFKM